jgi:hypothetical protein
VAATGELLTQHSAFNDAANIVYIWFSEIVRYPQATRRMFLLGDAPCGR